MRYAEEDFDQMLSDLEESLRHSKALERECEELEYDCARLTDELAYWNKLESWIEQVYPNAITEFNAICDIERGV